MRTGRNLVYMLSALASGIVSGVGNDSGHGICQTIRYGEYEVQHLAEHLNKKFGVQVNLIHREQNIEQNFSAKQ